MLAAEVWGRARSSNSPSRTPRHVCVECHPPVQSSTTVSSSVPVTSSYLMVCGASTAPSIVSVHVSRSIGSSLSFSHDVVGKALPVKSPAA